MCGLPALRPACFNPRLRTGGDFARIAIARVAQLFQSTPPHGRRRQLRLARHKVTVVSIHASAREATRKARKIMVWAGSFNPRLRTGGDEAARPGLRPRCPFQSTPPHGRRPPGGASAFPGPQVSIHASAREATRLRCHCAPSGASFNPRLRTGGDAPVVA